MHFDILVEDESGKYFLKEIMPRIIKDNDTFEIHGYKGIGRIPRKKKQINDVASKMLLNNLPPILNGYGKTYHGYGSTFRAKLIIICDLDDKHFGNFKKELEQTLSSCSYKPNTSFCIAIEELEAWLLGDKKAIKSAFPSAKFAIIDQYKNDSICGTWEILADALYNGGSVSLKKGHYFEVGKEKIRWATSIAPHMDIDNNTSPSFNYFVNEIRSSK